MVKVKICGVNSAPAMDAAVAAGVDWIGFVFFDKSPRYVPTNVAEALSARHPIGLGFPLRVGLFVDPSDDDIDDALEAVPLDVLQVYADAERTAELRRIFGISVWRAVGVASVSDLPDAPELIDGYVLDAKPPARSDRPGGNAMTFDWSILQSWQARLPWLLAGGLTSANVARAIAMSGATAVDVSSGVEVRQGLKDAALIKAFVRAARYN